MQKGKRHLREGRVVYAARTPVGRVRCCRLALLALKVALGQAQAASNA